MVLFSIPPLPGRQYLRRNCTLPPLLAHFVCDVFCFSFLLSIVIEDRTPILAANIWALSVRGGRVVHLVEELDERLVGDLGGIEDYLKGFGIWP